MSELSKKTVVCFCLESGLFALYGPLYCLDILGGELGWQLPQGFDFIKIGIGILIAVLLLEVIGRRQDRRYGKLLKQEKGLLPLSVRRFYQFARWSMIGFMTLTLIVFLILNNV